MKALILVVGLLAAPAIAGDGKAPPLTPRLIYNVHHSLAGVADIGRSCAESACTDFKRIGIVTRVERTKQGLITGIVLRTNGFDSQSGKIFPFEMAFGDAAMDLADPLPSGISRAIAGWMHPGMHVLVTGTMSGADGGLVIVTSVRDSDS